MYHLLYLLFGQDKGNLKSELVYSLLSFNMVAGEWSRKNIQILICTDEEIVLPPVLHSLQISFHMLKQEEIREWISKANKHSLVLKARVVFNLLQQVASHAVLVDTDTFFVKDPESLFRLVEQGNFLMHLKEYPISRRPKVYRFFRNRMFRKLNGSHFAIVPPFYMWNSGVVGVDHRNTKLLAEVIYLIEQISSEDEWPPEESRFIEQTSYSYYLQKQEMQLLPADDHIIHYWFFKEARLLLGNYFNYFHGMDDQVFRKTLEMQNARPEDFSGLSYEALPPVIFDIMKKYSLINEYHFECLPVDTYVGKLLRQP